MARIFRVPLEGVTKDFGAARSQSTRILATGPEAKEAAMIMVLALLHRCFSAVLTAVMPSEQTKQCS